MMKKNILLIRNYLDELYENPRCELEYNNDYELLIAVMLSAQTTDKSVNKVTKILFSKYNSLDSLASADINDLKEIIRPIGNFNKKSLNIINIARSLLDNFGGIVPKTHEGLECLSGVGRKTANVILGELYNIPSLAVDTHVLRVSNRLGLANTKDVLEVEKKLKKSFPKESWVKVHKQLVLFGRYNCKAIKPDCNNCKLQDICKHNKKLTKVS
ncbi:MAG: endonuclease III [Bacilli bacterium]|nr:endonuclease III [Bacilli bacterium]